ncbi:MAG: hypothetical protein JXR62_03175 [Bacilli bacterium]|nr:hypothetical protein [Bacilli bacterium]
MDNNQKKENSAEEKAEIENLLKAIEELEKAKKEDDNNKKRPRNFIAIEFGGVFHHNFYVNFVFNFILNLTLSYTIIELFNFADYDNIVVFILFILFYTISETFYRSYVLLNYFQYVIKSFGFIFYFGYVIIVYLLDSFVFVDSIHFNEGSYLVVFVGIFTIIRYILSTLLRQNFRKRNLR